jgi:hypothetical protein
LFILEIVELEEGEDGKKKRVGRPRYEGHSSASYAATGANKAKFENPNGFDKEHVITNVYSTNRLRWVGKDNGYYG